MDARRYLLLLPREGGLLADTADAGDLAAPVPACPGLTVGEVVRHTGSVYRVVLRWIREGRRPDSWERQPPNGGDSRAVVAWQRRGLAALVDELRTHAAEEPCATWWSEDRTFGFWRRRMTHETAVHRVDIQAALGEPSEVDAELALDGIDEVLRLWLGTRLDRGLHGGVGGDSYQVQVRAGTLGWHVRLGAARVEVRTGVDADAAADVSGTPAGLYLWLWGRRADDAVTITGDLRAARALRQALAKATQ